MSKKDYYSILELSNDDKKLKSDDFNKKIKNNYRRLCKQYHPDKNPGNKEAEESFKELSEAYEHLSDKDKKSNYDKFGHNKPGRGGYNPFSDHEGFDGFGGFSTQRRRRRGENMHLLVKLTMGEIYTGVKKHYKYNRSVKCDVCDGNGGTDPKTCTTCNGKGSVIKIMNTPFGQIQQMYECPSCHGDGTIYEHECKSCGNSGLKTIEEKIDFEIPHGVVEGMSIYISGKGQGVKGGDSGDLYINISEIPHKVFTRSSSGDLKMELKLKYTQLVLGDNVDIETIDGGKIRIIIPEYSQVGSNLRVQNKGLKIFEKEDRGDLTINLGVVIPEKINEETRELLNKLKNNL